MRSLVESVLRARLDQSFGPLPPVEAFVRRGCPLATEDAITDNRREQRRAANRRWRGKKVRK